MPQLAPGVSVPASELEFSFARSGGPGGQNVNKVSTKVVLHWNVTASEALPPDAKARFLSLHANRINAAGQLVLECSETRSQAKNRELCLERLKDLVAQAMKRPKTRIKTKPGKGAKARNRKAREVHSAKKAMRRKVDW